MTRIADHPSTTSKLSTLNIKDSNFEANETVEKLADILQSAFYLKSVDINNIRGSRKVKVDIAYANDEGMGSIKVKDMTTNEIICSRETTKKEAN